MDNSFNHLLDKRNLWVWHKLNNVYSCSLIWNKAYHINHYYLDRTLNILVPSGCTIESFSQELIRLSLRSEGICLGKDLIRLFKEEPLLDWTFGENTFYNIASALEDNKIFPLYLECGFKRGNFISGYGCGTISDFHRNYILLGFNKTIPSTHSIELFIFKYFSSKSGFYNDNAIDCGDELKSINNRLYLILEEFYMEWRTFKIEQFNPPIYDYMFFLKKFINNLGRWSLDLLKGGLARNVN